MGQNDPHGFPEVPGFRLLMNGPHGPAGGARINTCFADTPSPACPRRFNQEETIRAIWDGTSRKPRHQGVTAAARSRWPAPRVATDTNVVAAYYGC